MQIVTNDMRSGGGEAFGLAARNARVSAMINGLSLACNEI